MTKTAVVILNYNGERLLQKFLPSVIEHSALAEIIVADNGSTDASIEILKVQFPQVSVIPFDTNYGFCGGYNRALREVDAPYVVLLNSDIEVTSGWLTPLVDLLDNHPDIAAIQPKILAYHNQQKFEYAGAAGGFIDSLGYPFCRGRIFNHIEKDLGQYNDEREIFWATGACLLIRSETYHRLGGFDEDFFAHMEEIDLCWKINRTNQKVFYCGHSTVYHVGAGTLGYESPRKTYLNFRNGLTLIFKHFTTAELIFKLPLRMLLDWLAAFIFLGKGEFQNARAVAKAHLYFLKSMKMNYSKRNKIIEQYPSYSKRSVHHGLIIIDYYLKRHRTFNNPK